MIILEAADKKQDRIKHMISKSRHSLLFLVLLTFYYRPPINQINAQLIRYFDYLQAELR